MTTKKSKRVNKIVLRQRTAVAQRTCHILEAISRHAKEDGLTVEELLLELDQTAYTIRHNMLPFPTEFKG